MYTNSGSQTHRDAHSPPFPACSPTHNNGGLPTLSTNNTKAKRHCDYAPLTTPIILFLSSSAINLMGGR